MKGNYEKSTLLFRLIDDVGNNKLGSYTYKNYIKTLNLKGDENILDFKSASGAESRHLAKKKKKNGGYLTCIDTSSFWMELIFFMHCIRCLLTYEII